jgi:hypothetical protein
MTHAADPYNANFWDLDFFTPYPTQDSDLLRQLGFLPGLKNILMLRQIHALEHATVWTLSENPHFSENLASVKTELVDNETLGGLSTDQGFYLYGQVNRLDLQRAVRLALQRLKAGEWNLAVHPRCGTNLSVAMLLTAGFVLGAHLLLPRGPIEQLIGLGLATSTAALFKSILLRQFPLIWNLKIFRSHPIWGDARPILSEFSGRNCNKT